MSTEEILARIKSLRTQLEVLEAEIRRSSPSPSHTFADLYGMLKDRADSSPEDIEASLYRVPEFPQP